MSISERVKHLKELSDTAKANVYSFEALSQSLKEAADTIESLSAKLSAANMDKIEQKPVSYKQTGTCPKCETYNEVWEKRENTVHGDVVYCWHCGLKVQLK